MPGELSCEKGSKLAKKIEDCKSAQNRVLRLLVILRRPFGHLEGVRGGDVDGLLRPLEIEASTTERDLIVGAARRREAASRLDRARSLLSSPESLRKLNVTSGILLIAVGLAIPFL